MSRKKKLLAGINAFMENTNEPTLILSYTKFKISSNSQAEFINICLVSRATIEILAHWRIAFKPFFISCFNQRLNVT